MGYLEDLMGAASAAANVVTTPTDSNLEGFNREQLTQISMAEE